MLRSSFLLSTALLSVALFGVTACAITEKPLQTITLETPGTESALCFFERPGYRKRVWAPNTFKIIKDDQPMTVECRAPGNRKKIITVNPVSYNQVADAINSVTDNISNLKFEGTDSYPEKIVLDFRDMKPTSYPLPEYQSVLEQNPEIMGLEEFRPGSAALLRDRYSTVPKLQPRQSAQGNLTTQGLNQIQSGDTTINLQAPSGSGPIPAPTLPQGYNGGASADSLTKSMNPGVFKGSSASSAGGGDSFVGGTPVLGTAAAPPTTEGAGPGS